MTTVALKKTLASPIYYEIENAVDKNSFLRLQIWRKQESPYKMNLIDSRALVFSMYAVYALGLVRSHDSGTGKKWS